jgi:hypothetical protein
MVGYYESTLWFEFHVVRLVEVTAHWYQEFLRGVVEWSAQLVTLLIRKYLSSAITNNNDTHELWPTVPHQYRKEAMCTTPKIEQWAVVVKFVIADRPIEQWTLDVESAPEII